MKNEHSNNIFLSEGINVLSLFDGISCGQVALERAGIKVNNYFASEIDKHAIKVTQSNYPNTKQIGDVTKVNGEDLPKIDLLMGGSPCQGFSQAGKKLNFDDPRSKLFFEYVRILKETKPKYFLYENVVPKSKFVIDIISEYLGVQPKLLNSNLKSCQDRKRLYWANFEIATPEDEGILLKDIVGFTSEIPMKEETIADIKKWTRRKFGVSISKRGRVRPHRLDPKKSGISEIGSLTNPNDKCTTITASHAPRTYKTPFEIYELNVNECEQVQGLPIGYTDYISERQAKKAIGNGWTVQIITHIFNQMAAQADKERGEEKNIITANMHEPLFKTGT
jgi:DNA (cytosine-5)-methyltransferase 3A